jgi:hypothetical protein
VFDPLLDNRRSCASERARSAHGAADRPAAHRGERRHGKTFAITTLALRGVLAGIDIGRILIVTFTNAATAELRRRLRERLSLALETYGAPIIRRRRRPARAGAARIAEGQGDRSPRLRAALDGFDEAAIFTIHGFCQRALREFAFESGAAFDAELIGDPAAAARRRGARRLERPPVRRPGQLVAGLRDPRVDATRCARRRRFALHRELRDAPPVADDGRRTPVAGRGD